MILTTTDNYNTCPEAWEDIMEQWTKTRSHLHTYTHTHATTVKHKAHRISTGVHKPICIWLHTEAAITSPGNPNAIKGDGAAVICVRMQRENSDCMCVRAVIHASMPFNYMAFVLWTNLMKGQMCDGWALSWQSAFRKANMHLMCLFFKSCPLCFTLKGDRIYDPFLSQPPGGNDLTWLHRACLCTHAVCVANKWKETKLK